MDIPIPQPAALSTLPSGHFRLLQLTADKGYLPLSKSEDDLFDHQDVLVLHTHVASLENPPLYDALSYTWGNPMSRFPTKAQRHQAEKRYSSKVPVMCDHSVLYIGFSLYEALLGLRRTLRDHDYQRVTAEDLLNPRLGPRILVRRYIWIDAICINQSNLKERNAQVKLMHLIYNKADAVLIWLGPQSPIAETAAHAILDLSVIPELASQTLHLDEHERTVTFQLAKTRPMTDVKWYCMLQLLQRQWFRRAWIIQEAAWARIAMVLFNDRLWVDWNVVVFVVNWMLANGRISRIQQISNSCAPPAHVVNNDRNVLPPSIVSIGNIRHGLRVTNSSSATEGGPKIGLLELLVGFRAADCSVPHDKVYAIYSLCQDLQLIDSIPVDYSKPVNEVYIETATAILQHTNHLSILLYSEGASHAGRLSLPSWVPDWSLKHQMIFDSHHQLLRNTPFGDQIALPFCADGNLGSVPALSVWGDRKIVPSSGGRLIVQGKFVGSIKSVALLSLTEPKRFMDVLQDIPLTYSYFQPYSTSDSSSPSLLYSRNDETRLEAVWRTVVADCWKGCCPAEEEAGLTFLHFLALEYKRASEKLRKWHQNKSETPFNFSEVQSQDMMTDVEALLRFLSEDENECLTTYESSRNEYECGTSKKLAVSPPKRLLAYLDAGNDISELINSLQNEDEKSLSHYGEWWDGTRQIFSTDGGKLGIGPVSAMQGDEVWILNGGKLCFILRRRQEEDFALIGPSYVHGVMHGQELWSASDVALPSEAFRHVNIREVVLQ